MKFTKKLLALLLVFALAFCFVACGDPKPCEEHIDENSDGVCDREGCGALIPGAAVSEAVATSYVDAVFEAIEAAKTISFVVDVDTTVTISAARDKAGNLMNATEKDQVTKVAGTATIKLSYIEEERYDFMCELALTVDALGEKQEINEAVYFIDNVFYTETNVPGTWIGTEISAETVMAMLPPEVSSVLSGIDLGTIITAPGEEDIAAVKTAINEAVSGLFTVNEDGSIGIGFDAAAIVNPYLTALKAIDGEDTIASIINPYLMSAGVTTTVESLCDTVAASGNITVGQLYSAINVYLNDTYGKNIQGIFDEIMAIPELKSALVAAEVCTAEEFEQLKAIKIDTVIAEYTALTVDALLSSFAEDPAAAMTAAQLGAMAKTVVTTPLAQMEGFAMVKEVIDLTTLDAANSYLNIDLDKELGFERLAIGSELAFTTLSSAHIKEAATYFSTISFDFDFEISINAISTETTTIALPEGAFVVPGGIPSIE